MQKSMSLNTSPPREQALNAAFVQPHAVNERRVDSTTGEIVSRPEKRNPIP